MTKINIMQTLLLFALLSTGPLLLSAQNAAAEVNWLTFEELETALAEKPKKVFIDFYTDWCTYCRKMDKVVFTDPKVIELLNEEYYAVKFNAETAEAVNFGGQTLVNDQLKSKRRPLHQIAQLLALRQDRFVAPTLVVLDEDFLVTARYFEYLSAKILLRKLAD